MSNLTRAALAAEIAALLVDNTIGSITPAKIRQICTDLADSCAVDSTITSWADLQALSTTGLSVSIVKQWVESATFTLRTAQLQAGTDATDSTSGVYRPNDYATTTNEKIWCQIGH